jgi:hypothetical protein
MSTPAASKSAKKSKKNVVVDEDVDMTGEALDSVSAFPSTQIGSYLSQNYNPEVENKKVPGFICGRQLSATDTAGARATRIA